MARLIEALLNASVDLSKYKTGEENLDAVLDDLRHINSVMIEDIMHRVDHMQKPPHLPALELIIVKLIQQEQALAHWAKVSGIRSEDLADMLLTVRAASAETIFTIGHKLGQRGYELHTCNNCTSEQITDSIKELLINLPPTDPSIASPN
jgi:hypothetical protein